MITADHISTFNDQLARAKVAALRMLQDLAASLTDLDSELTPRWPGRELRLIAATILRTKPMTPPREPAPARPPGRDVPPRENGHAPAEEPAPAPDASSAPADPPPARSFLARFNPVAIRARDDLRTLVREGILPASVLASIPPGRSAAVPPTPGPAP